MDKKNKNKNFSEKLKDFWNKTIFSDMIAEKKADREFQRQMRAEAKKEAKERAKTELKEQFVQEELDKMKGKKKNNVLEKLSKGFESGTVNKQGDKFADMMGMSRDVGIKMPETKKQKTKSDKKEGLNFEDKIKRMLE